LLVTAIAGLGLSMAIGTITLWRAKRQVEENLAKTNEARRREFQAFIKSFGINDRITFPLLHEAAVAGIWDKDRRLQSYKLLINHYDEIAKTLTPDGLRAEVVAQAARRVGALRMAVGDRSGLDDYARAIHQYETISARTPDRIWIRADLISTLLEYAGHLEELGDRGVACARRRACEVADGLLRDADARRECFRMGVIPQVNKLIKVLSKAPDAAVDPSLADRLKHWIKENPEPSGPIIYLPRP
jgi:hypothetical protein